MFKDGKLLLNPIVLAIGLEVSYLNSLVLCDWSTLRGRSC